MRWCDPLEGSRALGSLDSKGSMYLSLRGSTMLDDAQRRSFVSLCAAGSLFILPCRPRLATSLRITCKNQSRSGVDSVVGHGFPDQGGCAGHLRRFPPSSLNVRLLGHEEVYSCIIKGSSMSGGEELRLGLISIGLPGMLRRSFRWPRRKYRP